MAIDSKKGTLGEQFSDTFKGSNEKTTGSSTAGSGAGIGSEKIPTGSGWNDITDGLTIAGGAGYLSETEEIIGSVFKKHPPLKNITLSREANPDLAFDVMVVYAKHNEYAITHAFILCGNEDHITAREYSNDFENALRMNKPGARTTHYTPDEALNAALYDRFILPAINKLTGTTQCIPTSGTVITTTDLTTEQLAGIIIKLGSKAIINEIEFTIKNRADVNINKAMSDGSGTIIALDVSYGSGSVLDAVNMPTAANFIVKAKVTPTQTHNRMYGGPNTGSGSKALTATPGYIDAVPISVPVPAVPGAVTPEVVRLQPLIIVKVGELVRSSVGMMQLALVTSLVLTEKNSWLHCIAANINNNNIDLGVLNIITNINSEATGTALELSSKALGPNEVYAALQQMYTDTVLFGQEVVIGGPNSSVDSIIADASEPQGSPARNGALTALIEANNVLTNGNFPKDYNHEDIFTGPGITLPAGYFLNKVGEKVDLAELGLAFVVQQSSDRLDAVNWAKSGIMPIVDGIPSYIVRTNILAKLLPEAVITGRVKRVQYTQNYMTTLANAARAAGLVTQYTPEIIAGYQTGYSAGALNPNGSMGGVVPFVTNGYGGGVTYTGYDMGTVSKYL